MAEAKYQASRDLLNAARRQRNEFLAYIVQEFELPETTEGYGLETSQGVFRLVGRRVPPPADPPNSDTNNE